jgi:hypothetical protein
LKQDWGGHSDIIRKAFHHEPVTYSRKSNNEYIEIPNVQLSLAISGTPDQVPALIKSAEDGLFSRMIFYVFSVPPKWRKVASLRSGVNLAEHFNTLSDRMFEYYNYLDASEHHFDLTAAQWEALNQQYDSWLREIAVFVTEDASSTVIRLSIIQFRIAMILSVLRHLEWGLDATEVICEDVDFQIAATLSEVYLQHAILMFRSLPKHADMRLSDNMRRFFDALPSGIEFSRKGAIEIAEKFNIAERTVGKYLRALVENEFLLQPLKYGNYKKPHPES